MRARDNCHRCHGAKGGVRGNENWVRGELLCDYCHAEDLMQSIARKAARFLRYQRRYARHKPTEKGRGRTYLTHTLFPYGKPFDIVQLAQAAWGITPAQSVRLNR